VPLEVISKVLGHKDLKTTMIYVKISNPKMAKKMHEKWNI
jgi:site-specific recombinase XerD